MKELRIALHWRLQSLADWLWAPPRQWLRLGNVACRLGAWIYPQECWDDPSQWNGHW